MPFRGECRGRLHPHSCSTLALACFLDCWGELPSIFYLPSSVGRVIERACVCLSLGSARVVGRRRCCYASRHARVATEGHCGGRSRSSAHARLLRSPCSLGRSYCRKSPVCLLLSLMAAKSSLARARVFVEFLLCLWWLSRVRVRGHARAPACVIPCSSGVVGLVVYHRLCVQTVVACSRSCRRVGVGVSSGSCLAVSARHLGLSGASSLALGCMLCSLGRASWCV